MEGKFWKDKTVFLTGHTGFKGSWLSLWLTKLGAKVVGYALAPPTGRKLERKHMLKFGAIPAPEQDPPRILADSSRLFKEVGWRPSYDLSEGIDETIAWWRSHGDPISS